VSGALHTDVESAVGRISGDPDALADHSRQLTAAAAAMDGVAQRLATARGNGLAAWSGAGGMSFGNACYTREQAARVIAGQLDQTAGMLATFSTQRREAQERLRRARRDAREAQQRARVAKRALEDARADGTAARARAGGLARQLELRAMHGAPFDDIAAELAAAQQQAEAAAERARRAQRELDRAEEDFADALRRADEAREYAEETDLLAGAAVAAMAEALAPPPPPPPPVDPAPEEDKGNVWTGLGKGLEDIGGELAGLGEGVVRHADVLHPGRTLDQWGETASTGAHAVTHPGDTATGVWHSFTDPIAESYRHGGVDEAMSRGLLTAGAAVVGGKGLTKVGKLRGERGDGDATEVESRADLDVPESPPYARDALPELTGSERDAFTNGEYEVREMRAGSRVYRSEGADDPYPGRWLGDEPARTKGGTEALYNVIKWDNPLEVMREYSLRHDLTVYWGGVEGGTGRQAFVPPDIPREHLTELLERRSEWELP
jgi:uncharacterized protein YukE